MIILDLIAKRGYFHDSQRMKNIDIFDYANKQPIGKTVSSWQKSENFEQYELLPFDKSRDAFAISTT